MTGDRPNILFITSDQHRADVLGCAGNPTVRTPNLDGLARNGVRFERMYCQGPLCQPSRASLLTGRHVAEHGMLWNGPDMPTSWATMPGALQEQGYETAVVGKTHFHAGRPRPSQLAEQQRHIRALGFDHVVEEFDKYVHVMDGVSSPYTRHLDDHGLLQTYADQVRRLDWLGPDAWRGETSVVPRGHDLTTFVVSEAADWLTARSNRRPFFLWLSFVAPHAPFADDPDWAAVYADADIPSPTGPPIDPPESPWGHYLDELGRHGSLMSMPAAAQTNAARHYYGQVSLVDESIGRLLDVLDDTGSGADTWVVYTSDHGEMLGDHGLWNKMVFYLPSVLVPAIIRPPAGGAGDVVVEPVEAVDLTATMLELAGASVPVCGRSLLPRIRGEPLDPRPASSELSALGHHLLAVATDRYRYTYDRAHGHPCELFDLAEDPAELHNLVDDPTARALRDSLHARYISPRLAEPAADGVVSQLGRTCAPLRL